MVIWRSYIGGIIVVRNHVAHSVLKKVMLKSAGGLLGEFFPQAIVLSLSIVVSHSKK